MRIIAKKKIVSFYTIHVDAKTALVLFKIKMVYIRFIGDHKEYEEIADIENI